MQKNPRFPVSISETNYTRKPTNEEWKSMKYQLAYLDRKELLQAIKDGYNFCHSYRGTEGKVFGVRLKTTALFKETYLVAFDIDHAPWDFNSFNDSVICKPTISYTTPSHIEGRDNRYRLIYQFQEPIHTNGFYQELFDGIVTNIQKDIPDFFITDRSCRCVAQQMGGNGTGAIEYYLTDNIYEFKDFVSDATTNRVSYCNTAPVSLPLVTEKGREAETEQRYERIEDEEFKKDYLNITNAESYFSFRDKYALKYPFFNETLLPDVDEDTPFIELPEDYITIKRDWLRIKPEKRNNYSTGSYVVKVQAGKRTKTLFSNALLRRMMKPDINFDHLLFCLAWERQEFIDNRDGEISNYVLYRICTGAYDVKEITLQPKKSKQRFKVNANFCDKYEITKHQLAGQAKRLKNDAILQENYDKTLSVKSNLELLKEKGYGISLRTLYRWCQENAIPTKGKKLFHYLNSPENAIIQ